MFCRRFTKRAITRSRTPHFLCELENLQNASVNRAFMAYASRQFGFLPKWRHDAFWAWLLAHPIHSFTTGSESLHDITMGLFHVVVISGLAGSSQTDDSWQNRPFRGGRSRKVWGANSILQVHTLQGEKPGGSCTDVLGTELPLTPPHGHPKVTLPALTYTGVRCVCATPLRSELCFGSRLRLSGPRCWASPEERGMVGTRRSLNEALR